ncbi:Copine family protein 2, partial [Globisporangium splendens]
MGCSSSQEVAKRPGAAGSAMAMPPRANAHGFHPIPDRYETIGKKKNAVDDGEELAEAHSKICGYGICVGEVQSDLRKAGLESSNLIVASVISVIGRVLEAFDDDNIIPAFGFGDIATKGDRCFPFTPNRGCQGFAEVLRRYNELTPTLKLSGPTNFAPVIKEAIRTVDRDGGYHILVIIADGQVTNEDQTRQAIVEASNWPISIIMVGVGDGPWDMMKEFDDQLPARRFDNFQFVEYNGVMQMNKKNPEAGFAIMALMEIPVCISKESKFIARHAGILVARFYNVKCNCNTREFSQLPVTSSEKLQDQLLRHNAMMQLGVQLLDMATVTYTPNNWDRRRLHPAREATDSVEGATGEELFHLPAYPCKLGSHLKESEHKQAQEKQTTACLRGVAVVRGKGTAGTRGEQASERLGLAHLASRCDTQPSLPTDRTAHAQLARLPHVQTH